MTDRNDRDSSRSGRCSHDGAGQCAPRPFPVDRDGGPDQRAHPHRRHAHGLPRRRHHRRAFASARSRAPASSTLAVRIGAVITPLGWALGIATPLAFVFGYLLGWIELVTFAWACLLLVLIAVDLPHRPHAARRSSCRCRTAGSWSAMPPIGEVIVTNPRPRRVLGASVEIPVGRGPRGRHHARACAATAGSCTSSRCRPRAAASSRSDPCAPSAPTRSGWCAASWSGPSRPSSSCIRAPSPSRRRAPGFVHDLEGSATRDLTNSDVSFHALREYQPGDERRYIHWKSTAKTGTLHGAPVRGDPAQPHRDRAVSLARSDYANDDEFEMARQRHRFARRSGDPRRAQHLGRGQRDDPGLRQAQGARGAAALHASPAPACSTTSRSSQSAETALAITDVARVAARAGRRHLGRVPGLSAPARPPSELRSASTKFPVGVEVVAIVCDPDSIPGLRRVAGLSVLTIGYLEDLQRSLARSAAA